MKFERISTGEYKILMSELDRQFFETIFGITLKDGTELETFIEYDNQGRPNYCLKVVKE